MPMFHWNPNYHPSRFIRIAQIVLLILIVIGVILLSTQNIWVPKFVTYLLAHGF